MHFLGCIHGGNHNLLQGLANFDINFATQSERHRCDFLRQLHPYFKFGVDDSIIGLRKSC